MTVNMKALVIDDEPGVRRFVAEALREEGWEVCEAETAEHAFDLLGEQQWSLVFCDVLLGGADGYAVLRRFAEEQPRAQVVLMTGRGSAAGALGATAGGAYDYLLKPFGVEQVCALSSSVRQRIERLARPASDADKSSVPAYASDITLVGRSPAFVEVMKLVGRVAPTNLPVLITGESGTGKEVVADAIHRHSARANQSFVAVNCGALPAELIESELFGHVRGSFTGAERDRGGLFEEAAGGTIFLDEITETPPAFQVKLLRALQKGEVRRVGSNQVIRVNARVIAASNRDVEEEVRQGRFRQDLLYRLNAMTIHLPPLRERREDILPLARHFAAALRAPGDPPVSFTRKAIYLLETYPWPGNIRELENVMARAATLCDHAVRPEDLPALIQQYSAADSPQQRTTASGSNEEWPSLSEMEGRYVARVLAHTGGNKQAASRLLSVDPKTLDRMIKRHNLAAGHAARESGGGERGRT
ncbi:MAG TPA: sigma-54 dependent transcriptional regulator [Pyrinomonadaceae bacterium]|nr:sigma-54 dependent transcriptional regulator [Pyrinomonadaceae bacterium]